MRKFNLFAITILCASCVYSEAIKISNAPNASGAALVPASVTASGCIKTGTTGAEFNANCTSGKVGIGAAVPSAAVHVASGTILIENNASGGNDLLKMSNYANGLTDYSTWRVVNSSGNTGTFIWYLMGGSFADSNQYLQNSLLWESPSTSNGLGMSAKGTTGAGLNFYINGSNRMRINNDGIGIGTTSPGEKVDINGNAVVRGAFTVAGGSETVQGNFQANGIVKSYAQFSPQIYSQFYQTAGVGSGIGQWEMAGMSGDGANTVTWAQHSGIVTNPALANYSADYILSTAQNGALTEAYRIRQSTFDVNGSLMWGSGAVKSTGTLTGDMIMAGYVRFASKTINQLQAITPGAVGSTYFCSNCVPPKLVVSTGTSAGNFADAVGGEFK